MNSNIFWSCVQTLNFRVLPDRLTVLSTNFFFVIWTTYLSIVGNRKKRPAQNRPPPPEGVNKG